MHQTKNGNQWHFGLKAHIGVDTKNGLTPSFTTTPATENDLNQAGKLLDGDDEYAFADAGKSSQNPCNDTGFFSTDGRTECRPMKLP